MQDISKLFREIQANNLESIQESLKQFSSDVLVKHKDALSEEIYKTQKSILTAPEDGSTSDISSRSAAAETNRQISVTLRSAIKKAEAQILEEQKAAEKAKSGLGNRIKNFFTNIFQKIGNIFSSSKTTGYTTVEQNGLSPPKVDSSQDASLQTKNTNTTNIQTSQLIHNQQENQKLLTDASTTLQKAASKYEGQPTEISHSQTSRVKNTSQEQGSSRS